MSSAAADELNPIAASFGYGGLYWWQSESDLPAARIVDVSSNDETDFFTRMTIALGFADEQYIKTETKKAQVEEEKVVVEEKKEEKAVEKEKKKKVRLSEKDFELLGFLGRGRFGEVMLGGRRGGGEHRIAIKLIHKKLLYNSKLRERSRNEFKINVLLTKRGHPFVVDLAYAFKTEKCLCLALELVPCGELFQLTSSFKSGRKFPEKAARFYVSECLLAIEAVHGCQVLYRDLKPENVLLAEDGHVKISDFGLSKPNVTDPLVGATSMCGTPEYMAPEIFSEPHQHGLAVDFWALGTLLFELLDGHPPWYAKDRSQTKNLFAKITKSAFKPPKMMKSQKLSKDGLDLLKALLEKDKKIRLGSKGIAEVKAHPFFAMVDFDNLLDKKIDPPYQPKRHDLPASSKKTSWSDVELRTEPPRSMDITSEKFDQIFAGFDFQAPHLSNATPSYS